MSGINKVVLGDTTLIDLSNDTVSPEVLSRGYKAITADGTPIEGTYDDSSQSGLVQKIITYNGTFNASEDRATGYSSVEVDVKPKVRKLYVSKNGTYTASSKNVDGFSVVEVDIEAPSPITGYITTIDGEVQERNLHFVSYGNDLYTLEEDNE